MITFLIILAAVIAILIVLFVSWFFTMKANGKCPLCAIKRYTIPRKITMDISEEEDYNNGVALTPPMGWSSWNTFRNHIDQDLIYETAKAMVNSGLADAGYKYINLDDCWQSSMRDADGKLQGDLKNFSRGIPSLIKDINDLGLKVGLYTSNGTLTCEDLPASLGNEELDAKTLASWGCEFFKYDYCHSKPISGNCPAIEKIELNNLQGDDFNSQLVLKPDDAEFTGRARVLKFNDIPSGKAIGFLNHGAGSAIFEVNSLPQGDYAMTLVYRKSFSRYENYVQVTVNGEMHEVFFPTGKGFSDNGRVQLIVHLINGTNKITLQNPVATLADSSYIQYKRMGNELKKATKLWSEYTGTPEKPIVFSICEWGTAAPWDWGAKAGNMWRTTHDITANWFSIMALYKYTIRFYESSRPGGWNDPDMLEVGNGKLTEDENRAHFSLWCMMAAPLMLGNDIRKFVDGKNMAVEGNSALKIVTNKHLIAIDQDTLGKSAKIIKKFPGIDVLARPLANGDIALCFLNKSRSAKNVKFDLNTLADDSYLQFRKSGSYEIHNLWSDERGNASAINASLPKHSVKVYRIKAV